MADRGAVMGGQEAGRGVAERSHARTLVGGAIGHFIEWYDWSIYGFLAGVFAPAFFPSSDQTASLILAYGVFGLGFIARPIGAIFLSPYADKYGRRALLSLAILLSGLGSLMIALCPTYAQIGVAAPLVMVVARLIQGFSAGGEYQIAITFLNEHASVRNRALAASPQQVSIGIAVLAAVAVATLTTKYFSADDLASWGWRAPFLIGAVLALYGFYLRIGIAETPAFEKIKETRAKVSVASILAAIARFPKQLLIVFVIQINTVQYYLWMILLPTYATMVGHLDRAEGFAGSILASIAYCICVPLFAHISDRVGRKPFLVAAALAFLLFTYPLLSLFAVPQLSFATFAFVAVAGAIFISLNNGVLGTVFAELFPTEVRASGIGIPYAICGAIFGGTAPAVVLWLNQHGGPLYVSIYVMAISAVTLATHLLLTPETRGVALD